MNLLCDNSIQSFLPQGAGPFLLSLTWILPLASAIVLLAIPAERRSALRRLALTVNGLNLALVLLLGANFWVNPPVTSAGSALSSLAYAAKLPWLPELNAHYRIGVDALSLSLMFLAAVVVFCGAFADHDIDAKVDGGPGIKPFLVLLQLLTAGVFGSFIAFDLLLFFVFNELTLIPTFLLIALYGSGRREYAAMKLTLLLMGGSVLILVGILGLYFQSGIRGLDILELSAIHFDRQFQLWAFPVLFLGFGLLGNLFPLHIWSPDGHASAPTAVSMLLAGVHMKLGSYGCLRIAMYLLPEGCRAWMDIFLALALAGTLWGAFVAARQKDLKYLNAYSSVSHCALVFVGLGTLSATGLRGAALQMVAHGFITAALFYLIGSIHSRTHARNIPAMSGLMARMPFLSVCFILAGFAALGLPGMAGFVAEFNIFLAAFASPGILAKGGGALALLSIVVTAIYILRATQAILHGPLRAEHGALTDAGPRERVPVLLLLLCILALGLYPGPYIELLDQALAPIMENLTR